MSHQEGEIGPIWTLILVSPLYLFMLFMLIGGVFGLILFVVLLVMTISSGTMDKDLIALVMLGLMALVNLGVGLPGTRLMHEKMRPHVEEIREGVTARRRAREDERAQGGELSLSECVGGEGGLSVVAAREEGAQGVVFSTQDTADARQVHHHEETR